MEWDMLKARVYARHKVVTEAKWEEIMHALKEELPNITAVIDLILTIPASSADAERGFSRLKLLKTKCRTALKEDRVTDQLFIIMQSPSIEEFDPVPAIDLWNKGGLRARRVSRDQVSLSDDDDIEEDEEDEEKEEEEEEVEVENKDSDDVEEQDQDEEEEEEEHPDSTTARAPSQKCTNKSRGPRTDRARNSDSENSDDEVVAMGTLNIDAPPFIPVVTATDETTTPISPSAMIPTESVPPLPQAFRSR